MDQTIEKIIKRLQARVKDPRGATDDTQNPVKPFRPESVKLVASIEKSLRFRLPKLLRQIYTEVGNGGLGPHYGFLGLKRGATCEGEKSVVSLYQEMRSLKTENRIWNWPAKLLPFCCCGCGMWICLDCTDKRLRLFIFDPNNLDEEGEGDEGRVNWANAFWDMGLSFSGWLDRWLEGNPPTEPRRPTIAWIKRRLGFRLPKKSRSIPDKVT
jgi:hypothetical protein